MADDATAQARHLAEQIAYERGPIEDSWSSGHSCCSYGCCGGGKEIDRDELARVIAAALTAATAAQEAEIARLKLERDRYENAQCVTCAAHLDGASHDESR